MKHPSDPYIEKIAELSATEIDGYLTSLANAAIKIRDDVESPVERLKALVQLCEHCSVVGRAVADSLIDGAAEYLAYKAKDN